MGLLHTSLLIYCVVLVMAHCFIFVEWRGPIRRLLNKLLLLLTSAMWKTSEDGESVASVHRQKLLR